MTSPAIGIVGVGAYLPRLRLERAAIAEAHAWFNPGLKSQTIGQRAMACWDEDAVTMAVEAARACCSSRVTGCEGIDSVAFASITPPFADRQNAVIVKEALNLPDATETADFSGGRRAGTAALLSAFRTAAQQSGVALCVAAEKAHSLPASEAEMEAGDGAAAVLIGSGPVLARLVGAHSVSMDFVDRFRATGMKFEYGWEARWIREEGYGKIAVDAVREALRKYGLSAGDIRHFAMPAGAPGGAARVARALKLEATVAGDELQSQIGCAGAAQPLLLLIECLERATPGEKIVVVGFGQGCDVLVFEAGDALANHSAGVGVAAMLAQGKPTRNYMQYLVFNGLLPIDRGMRAEMDQKTALTALYRDRKTVLGLVGSRDPKTGKVQYPASAISVHPEVQLKAQLEDYPFADRLARIVTFTADRLAYSINPPACYGMIEFTGGGRMVADFADVDTDDLVVGREMKMVFRIKALDEQRGFVRYFWKAMPVRCLPAAANSSCKESHG